jgi:hypothetical protein
MLIIPLIALGVWILSAIFRGAEEQRDKERLNKSPDEGRRVRQPRRAQTELERFLEEARNRRLGASKPDTEDQPPRQEEILEAIPVAKPVSPRPAQRQRPHGDRPKQRAVVAETPRRALEMEAPPAHPRRGAGPPLALPVNAPPAPAPPPEPDRTPPAAAQKEVVVIVPPTRPRPAPPGVVKLMQLLKDKQTLATAVLLSEVLDKPLCLRRR